MGRGPDGTLSEFEKRQNSSVGNEHLILKLSSRRDTTRDGHPVLRFNRNRIKPD